MTREATVRLDKYAIFEITRERSLRPAEQHLLLVLVLLADWRTWRWAGTLREIHEDTGMATKTIARALNGLAAAGCLCVRREFGPNSPGEVEVVDYERLVRVSASSRQHRAAIAGDDSTGSRMTREEVRIDSDPTLNRPVTSDANQQGKEVFVGNKATRQEGCGGLKRHLAEICKICHQPCDGTHPFDHPPVPILLDSKTGEVVQRAAVLPSCDGDGRAPPPRGPSASGLELEDDDDPAVG